MVYTKMVGIMGFTWAAGFLAAFTEQAALWWVYIVLNGLQGTFIAFSFVLNARLLRFLKTKMSEKKSVLSVTDTKSKASGIHWRTAGPSQQLVQRQLVHNGSSAPPSDGGGDGREGDANVSLSGTSVTIETNVDF